ncbi:hypothetical protein FA15DRAFT_667627 [Coprinopsis marcescibilis]|uniref:L-type lectin-like domain-containing protein n=1 Tax=Coprinopsis marcescibilis TaxID=230819 RepID=A0A5C3L0K6_COPMA|nr:hypothetical protein FA15DRAFT_667627 [Coprinopsis marcescibilis]
MLSGCWSVLSVYLVVANLLFTTGVTAKEDAPTKMGNNTIERTVQLRTHSIYPPYIDQDLQNRWWDFGADAYINTNKHVRLTQNKASQTGWLWSRLALTATNWVIEAEFKIDGQPTHLYGDGMAMWITTERAQTGPIFGSKDYFNGFAIFLDTYSNERHNYGFPRVIGVKLDGSTKYDYHNDGDSQALGSCSAAFRRTKVGTKLKVTYVKDTFLDVKIQYKAWDTWTDCFYIPNVSLPANPFIGFTAMTGEVHDAHDIISVTSYSAILSPADAPRDTIKKTNSWGLSRKHDEDSTPGTWSGFFLKLIFFGGICAGGWYGYKEYQRRQRYSGFSFNGPSSASTYGPNSASTYGPNSASTFGPNSAMSFGGGLNSAASYGAPPHSAASSYGGPPSAASSYGGPPSAASYGPNSASSYGPNSASNYGPNSPGFGGPPSASSVYSGPTSANFRGPPTGGSNYGNYADSKRAF